MLWLPWSRRIFSAWKRRDAIRVKSSAMQDEQVGRSLEPLLSWILFLSHIEATLFKIKQKNLNRRKFKKKYIGSNESVQWGILLKTLYARKHRLEKRCLKEPLPYGGNTVCGQNLFLYKYKKPWAIGHHNWLNFCQNLPCHKCWENFLLNYFNQLVHFVESYLTNNLRIMYVYMKYNMGSIF